MKRVHIVGAPRSGTSLMLELMHHGFVFEYTQAIEISVLKPPPEPWQTLLTKKPGDHHLIQPLLEADRGHWFVFMLRDPRDVVVSRHPNAPDRYWANLGQWRRSMTNVEPVLNHERLLVVRYEDLVANPDRVQSEIATRLAFLKQRGSFSRFHETSTPSKQIRESLGGVRAIGTDSIGKWRQHKARLLGQLQIHDSISNELIQLGYEQNADWLKELDGIEPDRTPGFFDDELFKKGATQLVGRRRRELEQIPSYLARLEALRRQTPSRS